ncbi:hypothetical protein AVEN_47518-1 [Araneus ventricosus]|uniref:Uncharacterized protein n=1 Tax=Araneus ventricosus TaxID=182803 RepID=A0A4Y2FDW1_ARAVE|nr:hypothetical protein AVEN_47518-1 [Araneus ventricosus]
MPGHLRRMSSRWPSDYFLFPKLKEHLFGTKSSSDSDVKTVTENRLSEQGRDFYQAGLNQSDLRSDKCLNRFDSDSNSNSCNRNTRALLGKPLEKHQGSHPKKGFPPKEIRVPPKSVVTNCDREDEDK